MHPFFLSVVSNNTFRFICLAFKFCHPMIIPLELFAQSNLYAVQTQMSQDSLRNVYIVAINLKRSFS
ncbi:hypothetical protein BpHYR1_043425 [Brachionus plicatilis]|uniref:Uncharacterized protein n=1 Tax=Brachionus plicatilis TaxID=10195 RepID=A0A3M7QBX0_BRAPC|nr:hypothetical protein BpHYR1_043425 [Brachionus plicatilis]